MQRSMLVIIAVLVAFVVTVGTVLLVRKHNADQAALSAARDRYAHLENTYARVSYAMDQFQRASATYDSAMRQGVNDSRERHRLWLESPYDLADTLTSVRSEQQDVQHLGDLAQLKASAARSAATAFGSYYGDTTLNGVSSDITSASEAELKYLADWSRAADAVNDIFTNRINGRWDYGSQDDIEALYRASDEDRAVSASRWSGVASRLTDLQNRLRNDLSAAQPSSSSALAANTSQESPEAPALQSSPAITAPASTNATSASPLLAAPAAPVKNLPLTQQGPVATSNILSLLRATAALTVSSNPDGHSAYVTVPDTPASGTADANRMISGQLADGRWVVFVPLASGSPSTGDTYSLMWVWNNGQAQFVGEIPAENSGLGQLSTSIRNGEIYISWPVCCPRATRIKILTLDGIRLRPLSDTTS